MPYCAARLWLQNIDMRFVMDKRPNIILLMADQMRGDCLGIAGHPDVKHRFSMHWPQRECAMKTPILPVQPVFPHVPLFTQVCHRNTRAASGMRI